MTETDIHNILLFHPDITIGELFELYPSDTGWKKGHDTFKAPVMTYESYTYSSSLNKMWGTGEYQTVATQNRVTRGTHHMKPNKLAIKYADTNKY